MDCACDYLPHRKTSTVKTCLQISAEEPRTAVELYTLPFSIFVYDIWWELKFFRSNFISEKFLNLLNKCRASVQFRMKKIRHITSVCRESRRRKDPFFSLREESILNLSEGILLGVRYVRKLSYPLILSGSNRLTRLDIRNLHYDGIFFIWSLFVNVCLINWKW